VTTAAVPVPLPIRIPVRDILPWAVFAGILMLAMLYFVGTEDGALSLLGTDNLIHEFLHDGRHLLGFPCH
jgi:hypothetical protein